LVRHVEVSRPRAARTRSGSRGRPRRPDHLDPGFVRCWQRCQPRLSAHPAQLRPPVRPALEHVGAGTPFRWTWPARTVWPSVMHSARHIRL